MTSKNHTEFHIIAAEKGWILEEIGKRWGLGVRQMSRIANNPKTKDIDAVKGLTVFRKSKK
jgi:hypothetical protein